MALFLPTIEMKNKLILKNNAKWKPYYTKTTTIQGRSQYEANRGTKSLSHLRFDPGSVLFKRSHHKDPE